jgi:hypothetical protein
MMMILMMMMMSLSLFLGYGPFSASALQGSVVQELSPIDKDYSSVADEVKIIKDITTSFLSHSYKFIYCLVVVDAVNCCRAQRQWCLWWYIFILYNKQGIINTV